MLKSITSISIRCNCNFDYIRCNSIVFPSGAVEWTFNFENRVFYACVSSKGENLLLFNDAEKIVFSYQNGEGELYPQKFNPWRKDFVLRLLKHIGVELIEA